MAGGRREPCTTDRNLLLKQIKSRFQDVDALAMTAAGSRCQVQQGEGKKVYLCNENVIKL